MAKTNKTPKAEDNAELRTISLLKILNTYSDENHELSTKNIMDKLQKECGVTVHRTTVGKNNVIRYVRIGFISSLCTLVKVAPAASRRSTSCASCIDTV